MSRLPKGTLASRNFLESIILRGAMAKAFAVAPFLDFPVVRDILEKVLEEILVDPTLDEGIVLLLAGKYVLDHKHFDKSFITLKMLDQQNAPLEVKERALKNAEKDMYKFLRRGPLE